MKVIDKNGKEYEVDKEHLQEINKIDFSKFVSRVDDILYIKGKKMMITSYKSPKVFLLFEKGQYIYPVDSTNYEVVNMSDLKINDVFIDDDLETYEIKDFEVFIGRNKENEYYSQYIDDDDGFEVINFYTTLKNYKVKRFLRE